MSALAPARRCWSQPPGSECSKGRREPEGCEQVGEDETCDLGDDPVLDSKHVQRERLVRRIRCGPQVPRDRRLSVGLSGYTAQLAAKAGGARIREGLSERDD
jgi:hypothetical protein